MSVSQRYDLVRANVRQFLANCIWTIKRTLSPDTQPYLAVEWIPSLEIFIGLINTSINFVKSRNGQIAASRIAETAVPPAARPGTIDITIDGATKNAKNPDRNL